ncbi:MAG: hypothetical protein E7578_04715 [Ruminococcaceae bacterium]|nr:hypothetical protein [Oscillospiraceae bacterium]
MEYKTKPTGKPSDFYAIGLVVTGAIFWRITFVQDSLIALYQLLSVIMFGAAMYLLIRYRLTVFSFRIEGRNGAVVDIRTAMPEELDFVVGKMRGKGAVPLARLSLDELKSVKTVSTELLKDKARELSLFKYHPDMSPDEGVLIVFSGGAKDIGIFSCLSSEMLAFLEKTASDNLRGVDI